MPRSPYRYGLTRRAARLPQVAGSPIFIDKLTPWAKQLVRGRHNLNRAALADPGEIARHMGLDLVERVAVDGGATEGDLTALGWTAAQIAAHGEKARIAAQAGLAP
jgi:hypothetical protein